MTRIVVQPEHLRVLASQCRRQADDLRATLASLSAALGGLDWETRLTTPVEGAWQSARSRGYALADQAESMAHVLERKAQAFEEADRSAAAQITRLAAMAQAAHRGWLTWGERLLPAALFPEDWLQRFLTAAMGLLRVPVEWSVTGLAGVATLVSGLLVGSQPLRSLSSPKDQPVWRQPPRVPSSSLEGVTVRLTNGRTVPASALDGRTPVEGLDSTYGKPGQFPVKPAITSTPQARSPELYAAVINQFGVEGNPRYAQDAYTYCNTFAGDVARAMGVPLPTKAELLGIKGDPATVGAADLHRWFTTQAASHGWREVDADTPEGLRLLQEHVNAGRPAVAVDPGHIAVVRPEQNATTLADLRVAQAGAQNANDIRLGDVGLHRTFRPRFFIHD